MKNSLKVPHLIAITLSFTKIKRTMKPMNFVFLMLLTSNLLSQSESYRIKFSHEIEKQIADEELRFSRAGFEYLLIGEYFRANTFSEQPISWGIDTLKLDHYEIADALTNIVKEAKNHQIVIISENHLKPQHRIFAKRIIKELREIGFNHMGFETLAAKNNENELSDSNLVTRNYPLNSYITGTYTLESNMSNLVRHTINLGYQLFAYENTTKIAGRDRDEVQAANILKYLEDKPDAKIIIYCGFHHAIESDNLKYDRTNWMAKEIKEVSGIDPLTIYQDNFTEKFISNQHSFLSKVEIENPSIFVTKTGEIAKLSDNVDIEIIHPLTTYRYGRPGWLFEDNSYKAIEVRVENEEINYPIIASAFPLNEENSVPIDRIEIRHKFDKKYFVLGPGEYRIELFNYNLNESYLQEVKGKMDNMR